jgi:hypothetical protein
MQWLPFYSPFPSLKKASFNNFVLKYGFLFRLWFSPWRAYKAGKMHVPPLHLPSLKKCRYPRLRDPRDIDQKPRLSRGTGCP